MAVDLLIDRNSLDFSLDATGDLAVTEAVVEQDAWKRIAIARGNFVFDESLGSLLYRIPQYGNTAATRELVKGYIKLALQDDIDDGRISLVGIDVTRVTPFGASFRIDYIDLTTQEPGTITSL